MARRKAHIRIREEDELNFLNSYLESVRPDDTGDMERAIIQCMLSDSGSCINETSTLLPEMFAYKIYRELFISIKALAAASSPVNVATISENLQHRKIDIQEKQLTEFMETCDVKNAHIIYYVQILRYLYLQTQFYNLMSLAPLVLGEKANITNFFDIVKPVLMPLNRALFDTFDGQFKPHWITNGTTTYKVLKSKFDSGGYVWVGENAVKEEDLLAAGFWKL